MLAEELSVNIEESPIATLIMDAQGEIAFLNKAARKMFGKISLGMKFSLFRSDEEIPEILKNSTAVKLALDEGASLQILISSEGQTFFASVFCSADKDNCKSLFIRDINSQINYITQVKAQVEIESSLQRSSHIRNGDLEEALHEIALASSKTMDVSRLNIWEIDEGFSSIKSLVNYDKNRGGFIENLTLYRYELPNYFSLMQTEEIIVTPDAMNSPRTVEIRENYLIPFGILSMLDTPIRIEGKMVGIVCFEDTVRLRQWNVSEQNFATSVAQIVAQTLETHRRQKIQQDLEQALAEKKVLLAEINHRVKNNFSVIGDLLRLQETKATDEFHKGLFAEMRGRLLSMTMIHRQLYLSGDFGVVNFRDFLLDLAAYFRSTFASDGVEISTLLDNCRLPIGKAVLCGLVINELLTNACRKNFGKKSKRMVTLRMSTINDMVTISVSHTGGANEKTDETGLELINELVGQLRGFVEHSEKSGAIATLSFSVS
jgi:two-component sensor histidine kinase